VVKPAVANANVGVILLQKGRTMEAERALRQALHLEPTLKQAQVALAKLESLEAEAGQQAPAAPPADGEREE
jgi:Tfp pilus assembly protein PilF